MEELMKLPIEEKLALIQQLDAAIKVERANQSAEELLKLKEEELALKAEIAVEQRRLFNIQKKIKEMESHCLVKQNSTSDSMQAVKPILYSAVVAKNIASEPSGTKISVSQLFSAKTLKDESVDAKQPRFTPEQWSAIKKAIPLPDELKIEFVNGYDETFDFVIKQRAHAENFKLNDIFSGNIPFITMLSSADSRFFVKLTGRGDDAAIYVCINNTHLDEIATKLHF